MKLGIVVAALMSVLVSGSALTSYGLGASGSHGRKAGQDVVGPDDIIWDIARA